MFTADITVVETFCLFLGQTQDTPGALSESFPIL
jgi:hypothetical protein